MNYILAAKLYWLGALVYFVWYTIDAKHEVLKNGLQKASGFKKIQFIIIVLYSVIIIIGVSIWPIGLLVDTGSLVHNYLKGKK